MLQGTSSVAPIASDNTNIIVSLKSPDSQSTTKCTYDLVWEWTGTDQYTISDTTLPLSSGVTYNFEMSVKANSTTTGNIAKRAYINETDLSKFTWSGTKGQSGYKAVIAKNATILSQNATTPTVTTWNISSQIYNIPANQQNLLGKEFKAKIYVSNVECNITSEIKPVLLNGTLDTIGSKVAIDDEQFYIINSTTTNVTMLSEYNLLVGRNYYRREWVCSRMGYTWNGTACSTDYDEIPPTTTGYNLQSEFAHGWMANDTFTATVLFDSEYTTDTHGYWTDDNSNLLSEYGSSYPTWIYNDNATIKSFVDTYKNKLESVYNITISEARLITFQEILNLGCIESTKDCSSAPSWLTQVSFWTGTAINYYAAYDVYTNKNITWTRFFVAYDDGVRPVLTINKNEFQ